MKNTRHSSTVKNLKSTQKVSFSVKQQRNRVGVDLFIKSEPRVKYVREIINSAPTSPKINLSILMLLDEFNIGGTETYALTTSREFLRKGIDVVVAGKKGRILEAFVALGCPVYEIDFFTDQVAPSIVETEETVEQLKRIIKAENISIVHAHQLPSGTLGIRAAKQLNIPMVFTVHGTYYDSSLYPLLAECATVISVSPVIHQNLLTKHIFSQIIPNGIEPRLFEHRPLLANGMRKSLGIPENVPIVTYAARLTWEKATICREVIEACIDLRKTAFPNIHLLILGEGKSSDELKQLIETVNEAVEKPFIHFLGNMLNMSAYYSISDCFVGTGRAALEAMACECLTVAVGSNGYFGPVSPTRFSSAWDGWFGDHHAEMKSSASRLSTDIGAILEMPEHLKLEWAWLGKRYIKENFSITDSINPLWDAYQDALLSRKDIHQSKLTHYNQ